MLTQDFNKKFSKTWKIFSAVCLFIALTLISLGVGLLITGTFGIGSLSVILLIVGGGVSFITSIISWYLSDIPSQLEEEELLEPVEEPIFSQKISAELHKYMEGSQLAADLFTLNAQQQSMEFHLHLGSQFNPAVISKVPQYATLDFILKNTDYLGLDVSDQETTAKNALALMIASLEQIRSKLAEEDRDNLNKLLQKFQCAFDVEVLREAAAKHCNTATEYNTFQKGFNQLLIEHLETKGALYLASGWVARPSGHNIMLELTSYRRESDGMLMVKGRIQNRGAGVELHPAFIRGSQIAYDPELILSDVPFEVFKQSSFLNNYFQLGFTKAPQEKNSSASILPTSFTQKDFYNVFLPSWPAHIETSQRPKPQIAQRGPTCTIKPLMTEMMKTLGDTSGRLAKFYITKASWENYIIHVGLTEENCEQLAALLPKLSRRAIKLKEEGILPEQELLALNEFSKSLEQKIAQIRIIKAQKLNAQQSDLHSKVQEDETYSLNLPLIKPLPQIEEIQEAQKAQSSKPLLKNMDELDPESFIAQYLAKATQENSRGYSKKAKETLLYALRSLPKASEKSWDSVKNKEKVLKNIQTMHEMFLRVFIDDSEDALVFTPEEACIFVKTLGITYHLVKNTLPQDLCRFYANGLQNLLRGKLPALFSPLLPQDLEVYRDAIHFIIRDVSKSSQPAVLEEYSIKGNITAGELTGAEYVHNQYYNLADGLDNPELKFLHSISRNHPEWHGTTQNYDFNQWYGLTQAYHGHGNKAMPIEYLALRYNFFLTAFVLDFRGNRFSKYVTAQIDFSGIPQRDLYYFTVQFAAQQKNPLAYNQGVFADVFPELASPQTEIFATELLGKEREIKETSFNSHNALSLFQKTEYLASKKSGTIHLSPLEIQDLLAVRTPDALPLVQLEHLFSGNIKKLEQPLFQSLFMTLLFKVDYIKGQLHSPLIDALKRTPPSHEIDNFFDFLKNALRQARSTQSWTIYFFLLRAYGIALSHCLYQNALGSSNKWVDVLAQEIRFIHSKDTLKNMTASMAAKCHNCLLSLVPYLSPYKATIPLIHRSQEIWKDLTIVQADASAAEDFHLQEDMRQGRFQLETLPYLSADGAKTSNQLPDSITEHQLYKALFKINYPARQLSPGYYEFIDDKGTQYRITEQEDNLRIFRLFPNDQGEGLWYAFQQNNPFSSEKNKNHPCSIEGGYLQTDALAWFQVKKSHVFITHKKTDELICQVTPQAITHPHFPEKILFKNYDIPFLNTLSRITSKKQILAWKDKKTNELSLIELKEFGMRFERSIDEKGHLTWKSSQYFGYYLDSCQTNSSLEPFPQYLVLTNDEGEKKIICPSRRYAPDKIVFAKQKQPKVYNDTVHLLFTYDIDQKGFIKLPEDPKALLYLIHLAIEKQDYSQGFRALKKLRQHSKDWDEMMSRLLSYLELPDPNEQNKFNSQPQACTLRLALKADMISHSSIKMSLLQQQSLKMDYLNYLNQLNNIPVKDRLGLKEEQILYSVLKEIPLDEKEIFVLQNRMNYFKKQGLTLTSQFEFNKLSLPILPFLLPLSQDWNWLDKTIEENMLLALEKPLPVIYTLRPGIAFVNNFLFYYKVLQEQHPPDLLRSIEELLKACSRDLDPQIQCLRVVLLDVLSHPQDFPPCDAFKSNLGLMLKTLVHERSPVIEPSTFNLPFQDQEEINQDPNKKYLEPTSPKDYTPIEAPFADIPDTLLADLLKEGAVHQRHIAHEDSLELKEQLKHLHKLELFYTEQSAVDNPPLAREFGRLLEGVKEVIAETEANLASIQAIQNPQNPDQLMLPDIQASRLTSTIQHLYSVVEQEAEDLEAEEEALRNQLTSYCLPERALEQHAQLLSPLTLEEALVYFGRGEDKPFYDANPDITAEELRLLKVALGTYLVNKLNAQKSLRLLDDFKKVQIAEQKGVDSVEYLIAKSKALNTLKSKRQYTADQAPHLLVFEAFANICLREEQIQALDQLTNQSPSPNLILEARTGFGKSKALIPLWLYLTAKKRSVEKLPGFAMMTVPAPLYQQQVTFLKEVLGNAFDQSVYAFQFNREKGKDLAYLRRLNQDLDEAAKKGTCLLTTVGSLHSLLQLKIKECLSLERTEENKAIIQELRALRHKAKHRLSNFFDESRECFDIRRYYDYSVGSPQAVPPSYCDALGDIYAAFLSLDFKLPFDFLDKDSYERNKPLTEAFYLSDIKEPLGRALLAHLQKKISKPTPNFLRYYNLDEGEFMELLFQDLMGTTSPTIKAYLGGLGPKKRGLYGIYKEQLNHYLPFTLTAQYNSRYTLGANRTVDCQERGIVREKTQFKMEELINFTIQGNLKIPFTLKDVSQFIISLKFRLQEAEDKQYFIEQDPEYQCYLNLSQSIPNWPSSIYNCSQDNLLQFLEVLNNPEYLSLKLDFIKAHILPKISVHQKKISSTAPNLIASINTTFGASATINADMLAPGLSTIEYLGSPIGTLLALWKNSQDAIYIEPSQEAIKLFQSVVSKYSDYRVIVDVAGTFRDLRDEREMARIIFEQSALWDNPPVNAFSYYNEAGENMILMRPPEGEPMGEPLLRSQSKTPFEKVYVFMRESAGVGADTPMSPTVKALVTVNSQTQRDLLLQGVGRLRDIQLGQRAGFLILDKDVPTFQNVNKQTKVQDEDQSLKVTLSDILSLSSINQGDHVGQDLFYLLRILLQDLVEQQFFEYVDDEQYSVDECMDLFHALRDFFIEDTLHDPASLKHNLGTVSIKEAVEQIKESFKRRMQTILEDPIAAEIIDLEQVMKDFDDLVDYERLPNTVKMGTLDQNISEVEVAELEAELAELETELAEQEQEQEQERETISDLPQIRFTPSFPLPAQAYELLGHDEKCSASKHMKACYSPLLEHFYGSTNFFRMDRNGSRPEGVLKTAYEYLIISDDKGYRVILMDQKDARAAIEKMQSDAKPVSKNQNFYLMSSTGKVIMQNASKDLNKKQWEAHPELTLITKIFSRRFNFSSQEIHYLASLEEKQSSSYFEFFNYCWPSHSKLVEHLKQRIEGMHLKYHTKTAKPLSSSNQFHLFNKKGQEVPEKSTAKSLTELKRIESGSKGQS